jgi:hypothetical protein
MFNGICAAWKWNEGGHVGWQLVYLVPVTDGLAVQQLLTQCIAEETAGEL